MPASNMFDTRLSKWTKHQIKITYGIEICGSVKLWNNHKRFGHSPSSVWKPLSLWDRSFENNGNEAWGKNKTSPIKHVNKINVLRFWSNVWWPSNFIKHDQTRSNSTKQGVQTVKYLVTKQCLMVSGCQTFIVCPGPNNNHWKIITPSYSISSQRWKMFKASTYFWFRWHEVTRNINFILPLVGMLLNCRVAQVGGESWANKGSESCPWTTLSREGMIDHRSYTHNLSRCEIKAWIFQAWLWFEPITSAIPVSFSTNWAIKPTGSLSHCEFVICP